MHTKMNRFDRPTAGTFRCHYCFSAERNHRCPVGMTYNIKPSILDWSFNVNRSESPEDPRMDPSQHIYTKLYVRCSPTSAEKLKLNPRNPNWQYLFTGDDHAKVYDATMGAKRSPPKSRDMFVMKVSDLYNLSRPLLESESQLKAKLDKAFINGHIIPSPTKYSEFLNDRYHGIFIEQKLKQYLHDMMENGGPEIHVRLTGGVLDFHGFNNCIALLFGSTVAMNILAEDANTQLSELELSDITTITRVNRIIAVPLTVFINKTADKALQTIVEMYDIVHPNAIIFTTHVIESLVRTIGAHGKWLRSDYFPLGDRPNVPWFSSDTHIPVNEISIILTVADMTDCCEISLPGGKRMLGELPLESCIRKTFQESCIQLDDPLWEPAMYLKSSTDCYLFIHQSML